MLTEMMRRSRGLLAITAALALLPGCAEGPTEFPSVQTTVTPVSGPQEVIGEIGGALYSLSRPESWNGELVIWVHGYVPDFAPIALPNVGAIRDAFLEAGYGFASSSFAENGWAVKDGVTRTRQLRELFLSRIARPSRTYLVGQSMGAAVAMRLAETNPELFDGVLPLCGIVGGSPLQLQYYFDVRTLFDYFYPGVLPGDVLEWPAGLTLAAFLGTYAPAIVNAIVADPAKAVQLASVDQVDIQYATLSELINSIATAITFTMLDFFRSDLAARTHGHNFYDNSEVVYSGTPDDAAINAGVGRYHADPDAANYLAHWYEPTGNLRIPVLTLHTSRDPTAPILHEQILAARTAGRGASAQLFQRIIERYGHCTMTVPEQVQALTDLAIWVKTGSRPQD